LHRCGAPRHRHEWNNRDHAVILGSVESLGEITLRRSPMLESE
jgi:hypothetical protein